MLLLAMVVQLFSVQGYTYGSSSQEQVYVALTGDDSTGDGSESSPYRTLEAARDHIRAVKAASGLPSGGAAVYLRGGDYKLDHSFSLLEADSGEAGKPIIYQAYPGEKVRLLGGVKLSGADMHPVNDPAVLSRLQDEAESKIVSYDLEANGITDYGSLEQIGFGFPSVPTTGELFIDGERTTLARWPNEQDGAGDTQGYAVIKSLFDEGGSWNWGQDVDRGPTFEYEDERPESWAPSEDIWMMGFWAYDYAMHNLKVKGIDPGNNSITGEQRTWAPTKPGQRYYYYNVLEELDVPGEWYVDREQGKLYVYPQGDLTGADIYFSELQETMVKMKDVSHVQFKHLSLEVSRGSAFEVEGGAEVQVDSCRMAMLGLQGVRITGGFHHGVVNSEITGLGHGGITLSGGDRNTLTPGEHYAFNNHIHRYAQVKKTDTPAIVLEGVGNRAEHNEINDAPHQGIVFWGNEHVIAYNHIHHVVQETNDAGAVYSYNDPTMRGNRISYNYFHDIYGEAQGPGIKATAVYLDNYISGSYVQGNLFRNVDMAVFIHGGRSNTVTDNIVLDSKNSLNYIKTGYDVPMETLDAVPIASSVWQDKYPELSTFRDDEPELPKYNKFLNNVILNSNAMEMPFEAFLTYETTSNWNTQLPLASDALVDPANGDYQLKPQLEALSNGLVQTELATIGLTKDYPFGRGQGEAKLTARVDGGLASGAAAVLLVGASETLHVSLRAADGSVRDVPADEVTFTSSQPSTLAVDDGGTVEAAATGQAQIKVKVDATGEETVLWVEVIGDATDLTVRLNAVKTGLKLGEELELYPSWKTPGGLYVDAGDKTSFESSEEAVAEVSAAAGVVTAKGLGTSLITAKTVIGGAESIGTIEVGVFERTIKTTAVQLEQSIVPVGGTTKVLASAKLDDDSEPVLAPEQISYEVSDVRGTNVLTIDDDGTVHALHPGRARIDVGVTLFGVTVKKTVYASVYEAGGTLPAGWELKRYASEGAAVYDSSDSSYTLISNGSNVWNKPDQFTFLNKQVELQDQESVGVSVSARIESIEKTSDIAAAGVTIREGDAEDARHVVYRVQNGSTVFVYRKTDGQDPAYTEEYGKSDVWYETGVQIKLPAELKLTREGDKYTGYHKNEAEEWIKDGTISVVQKMDNTMLAGVGIYSGNVYNPTEANVSNVQVETYPLTPSEETPDQIREIDPLDDWSRTLEHSDGAVIEFRNGDASAEGDMFSARKAETSEAASEWFTYERSGLTSYSVKLFYHELSRTTLANKLKVYVSSNNKDWSRMETQLDPASVTLTGGWSRTFVTPKGDIPAGTKYIRFSLENLNDNKWSVQLSEIAFLRKAGVETTVDDFTDRGMAHSYSDSDSAGNETDDWSREDASNEAVFGRIPLVLRKADHVAAGVNPSIVYHYDNLAGSTVKVFYHTSFVSDPISHLKLYGAAKLPTPPTPPGGGTGVNLLTNAGFESGLDSWSIMGGQEEATTDAAYVKEGVKAARVGSEWGGAEQYVEGITPGTSYRLSASAWNLDSSQTGIVVVSALDAADNKVGEKTLEFTQGTAYEEKTAVLTAPAQAVKLKVWYFKAYKGGDAFYVDQLSLAAEAAPPAEVEEGWAALPVEASGDQEMGGGWRAAVVKVTGGMPDGTSFLKVQLEGMTGGDALPNWAYRIGEVELKHLVPWSDQTAPVVTLNGAGTIELEQGAVFTDPGASAMDNVDGALQVEVSGSVNSAVVGVYVLTYTAVDLAGNRGQATRTVSVVAKPDVPDGGGTGGGESGGQGGQQGQPYLVTGDLITVKTDEAAQVVVPAHKTLIQLTAAALQKLGSRSLQVAIQGLMVTIPPKVINELVELDANGSIQLETSRLPEAEAAGLLRKGFKKKHVKVEASGGVYTVDMKVVAADGRVLRLDKLEEPLLLELPLMKEEQRNSSSSHVRGYRFNEAAAGWEYAGGRSSRDGSLVELKLKQLGTYALLDVQVAYTDVPKQHWAYEAIRELSARQIVQGMDEGRYGPGGELTRAQFAVMLSRVLGLQSKVPGEAGFQDVAEGAWYAEDVEAAAANGIIQGRSHGKFEPDRLVAREEMAVMLIRAYKLAGNSPAVEAASRSLTDGDSLSDWSKEAVHQALGLGLLSGKGGGQFDPQGMTTRAQAAKALYELILIVEQ